VANRLKVKLIALLVVLAMGVTTVVKTREAQSLPLALGFASLAIRGGIQAARIGLQIGSKIGREMAGMNGGIKFGGGEPFEIYFKPCEIIIVQIPPECREYVTEMAKKNDYYAMFLREEQAWKDAISKLSTLFDGAAVVKWDNTAPEISEAVNGTYGLALNAGLSQAFMSMDAQAELIDGAFNVDVTKVKIPKIAASLDANCRRVLSIPAAQRKKKKFLRKQYVQFTGCIYANIVALARVGANEAVEDVLLKLYASSEYKDKLKNSPKREIVQAMYARLDTQLQQTVQAPFGIQAGDFNWASLQDITAAAAGGAQNMNPIACYDPNAAMALSQQGCQPTTGRSDYSYLCPCRAIDDKKSMCRRVVKGCGPVAEVELKKCSDALCSNK